MRIHQHSQAFLKIILHHSNALAFLISLSFSAAAQEAEIVRPRGALAAGTVAAVAAANAAGSSVAWPLHLSTQGKYLEEQNGEPFLLVADAGWEFMTQLTEEEAVAYLDDRKTKGFNAVEIRVPNERSKRLLQRTAVHKRLKGLVGPK
jgi:hypothetical protein